MREYIRANPVKRGLAVLSTDYPYSSANPRFDLDPPPQRLKAPYQGAIGIAKAMP